MVQSWPSHVKGIFFVFFSQLHIYSIYSFLLRKTQFDLKKILTIKLILKYNWWKIFWIGWRLRKINKIFSLVFKTFMFTHSSLISYPNIAWNSSVNPKLTVSKSLLIIAVNLTYLCPSYSLNLKLFLPKIAAFHTLNAIQVETDGKNLKYQWLKSI